jgi:putative NADPH-quinone reductase
MQILIILGHPDPNSFNHAIASTCIKRITNNGHRVIFHDLYAEGFNPVIDKSEIPKLGKTDNCIKSHCDDLTLSDGIIIIHPNWWGQPPAILKGWIDRVLRPGIAYEFVDGDNGEGIPVGLLKAKTGLIFNTSNTSEKRENNLFGDPLETIWKNCILNFCGIHQYERRMFRIIVNSDLNLRKAWLVEAELLMDKYFPEII